MFERLPQKTGWTVQKKSDGREAGAPVWRESGQVCALSDAERHIGHIFREGDRWQAFDATQSAPEGKGFLCLGTFSHAEEAKLVVELSSGRAAASWPGAAIGAQPV